MQEQGSFDYNATLKYDGGTLHLHFLCEPKSVPIYLTLYERFWWANCSCINKSYTNQQENGFKGL